LEKSGISTCKGNKSSVLTCAAEFITELQRQNNALARDMDRRPHLVHSGGHSPPEDHADLGSSGGGGNGGASGGGGGGGGVHVEDNEDEVLGESGDGGYGGITSHTRIDYQRVFHDQGLPVAISSVRFNYDYFFI